MAAPARPARTPELLEAAAAVFLRYGIKKTSMDDVARAAGLSRQGLYLHFSSKDELFHATLVHVVDGSFGAARAALRSDHGPLAERLVDAFAAMHARHFAHPTAAEHVAELLEAAAAVAGTLVADRQRAFVAEVARALRHCAGGGTPGERAMTLEAAALGLKHTAKDAAQFKQRMAAVVRVVCPAASTEWPTRSARTGKDGGAR